MNATPSPLPPAYVPAPLWFFEPLPDGRWRAVLRAHPDATEPLLDSTMPTFALAVAAWKAAVRGKRE